MGRLSPNYGGNQIKQQQQNKPEIAGRVPVPLRPRTQLARRMFLSPPLCFAWLRFALLSQVRVAATATSARFLPRFQARRRPSSRIDRSIGGGELPAARARPPSTWTRAPARETFRSFPLILSCCRKEGNRCCCCCRRTSLSASQFLSPRHPSMIHPSSASFSSVRYTCAGLG